MQNGIKKRLKIIGLYQTPTQRSTRNKGSLIIMEVGIEERERRMRTQLFTLIVQKMKMKETLRRTKKKRKMILGRKMKWIS